MTTDPEAPQEILLVDDDGVERRFLLHDAIDVDERLYYLVESADDPEEVYLLKEIEGTLETVEGEEFDSVLALLEAEQ